MAGKKEIKQVKLTKKLAKMQIIKTLENTLEELKEVIGEKKFQRRIKRASEILSNGLPKSKDKKASTKKGLKTKALPGAQPILKNGTPGTDKATVLNEHF